MIFDEIRNIKCDNPRLRKFGLVMAVALAILGALLLWRHRDGWDIAFTIAAVFLVTGLAVPKALKPAHYAWIALSMVMGWVMTRVLLTLMYYAVVTPMGLAGRLLGKRFLDVGRSASAESYWVRRGEGDTGGVDYEKQF